MKETPGRRKTRLGVLGISTARCGKCLADCKDELDNWLIYGICRTCLHEKPVQQKVAGR